MRTHLWLFALILGLVSPTGLQAANLQVPATYARITDALAASTDGDTISVAAGLYSPSANGETIPLAISKNVSLLGAGYETTTIDAEMLGSVIRITAPGNVQVSGFTITGGFSFNGGGVWASS
ncbi:MAG: DUF1565 domain-containing protein, partial [Candidatus Eisenbacteria bacterium]|nr:DUF1565 domain-containing protein [Candidatus Eisenbacteria bacterium]